MADSNLVTRYIPAFSGNYTAGRSSYASISEITIHHCAGVLSIDDLGALWQRPGRNGSSHYGVSGTQIGQYVDEDDIAWTNSNWPSNCRAVTIETSNSGGAPGWPVADDTLATLIRLVADIARRNGLHPLVLGQSLTWHSMYCSTACPGPYLRSRLQYICDQANALNAAAPAGDTVPALSTDPIVLQIGPASGGDIDTISALAAELGLPCQGGADGVMLVGPASAGDQSAVLTRAAALGLPYSQYQPPAPADDRDKQITDLQAKLADMTAQRDAAAADAARATQQAGAYLQMIAAAKAALGV